jgi:hypothetical protein
MKIHEDAIYLEANDKVEANEEVKKVKNELFAYFGRDKGKNSVKVLLPDGSSGIIYRKELYPLADRSLLDRGFGNSAGIELPGSSSYPYYFQRYRCPQKECAYLREVLNFLPAPTCGIHNIQMEKIQ